MAVAKSPTYTVYFGIELEAQLRQHLSRWGLPVSQTPKSVLGIRTNTCAFFIYYSLVALPLEITTDGLKAELLDERGGVVPLRWFAGGGSANRQICWSAWSLDSAPKSTSDCLLRLKLKTSDAPVAEIKMEKF